MARKGISVWLSSSLTFIALLHLVESIFVIIFNNQIRLFQLYPIIGESLEVMTPTLYFWGSAVATIILWGITCALAFENPVETFLNKILSDAKTQSAVEAQLLEEKSEILDVMNETVEMNNGILAQVKDLTYTIRTEVRDIRPLKDSVEKLKNDLSHLKREIKKSEKRVKCLSKCPTCGKPLLPEFKICPYCGQNIKLLPEKLLSLKEYR